MNHAKKNPFKRIALYLFSLAVIVSAVCLRKKILSLIFYCLVKIYASDLELHQFSADYRGGGKIHIASGASWMSAQNRRAGSVKDLKLVLDLSKLYSDRKVLADVHARGVELDLDACRLPVLGSGFILPRLVQITDARVKYDAKIYELIVTTRLDGPLIISDAELFDGQNKSKIILSRSLDRQMNLELHSLPLSVIKTDAALTHYAVSGRFDMKNTGSMQGKFYFRSAKDDVASLAMTAHLTKSGQISIQQAVLNLAGRHEAITAKGYIAKNWAEADLSITADRISAGSIRALAGMGIRTKTKNWCVQSIKDGDLVNFNVRLYVKNIFSHEPEVQFKGKSKFMGLDLKYSGTLPQIDDLAGEVTFDDKSITFVMAGGKMISSQLHASTVEIDLVDNDMPLTIKTNVTGPIKDFIGFIPESSLERLEKRKIKLSSVSGWADAHISLIIPLSKEVVLANMTLNVRADLKQFKLPLFEATNLEGDLILKIENHLLSMIGSPLLDAEETNFKLESHLTDGPEFDNKLTIDALLGKPGGLFSLLGNKILVSGGVIPTKIAYLEKKSHEQFSIHAKLDHAKLSIPYLGIIKELSKASSFDLEIEKQSDGWKTERCVLMSPDEGIQIDAAAEFKQGFSLLTSLDATVKTRDNNIKVDLTLTESEYRLRINGSSIISNSNQLLEFMTPKDFSHSSKLSIFIDLDKVILKHGVTVNKISGRLSCYKDRCTKDAILMSIKDGNGPSSNMKIYNENGAFIIQTDNAAALLKGLDLYHDLSGGRMSIKLYPIKKLSKEAAQVRGEVHISNFQAIKTPLIGKLILLTPFSQIVEKLKGETLISFKTLDGSFVVKDKIVEVKRSIASGDLLTVTIKGYIDLLKKRIALKGRIIPNSLFNNLLASIQDKNTDSPESFKMGTDYKIDGNLAAPRVIVSPIGMLISLLTKPLSII